MGEEGLAELPFYARKADPVEIRGLEGIARYWCYLNGMSWEEGKREVEIAIMVSDLNNINTHELKDAWIYLRSRFYTVPCTFDGEDVCSEHGLSLIFGLLDYWAYSQKIS